MPVRPSFFSSRFSSAFLFISSISSIPSILPTTMVFAAPAVQEQEQETTPESTLGSKPAVWPWIVDPVYWPLSSAIAINGFLVGGTLEGAIQHKVLQQSKPIGGWGASVGAGSALLGTWLLAPTLSAGVAHPAQAASIGSGIMWGTLMGVELAMWNRIGLDKVLGAETAMILAGGMAGGLIAAAIPAPMSTGQVGVRNVLGALNLVAIQGIASQHGCGALTFGRNWCETPGVSYQEQAITLGAQSIGVVASDLLARSGDYDDLDTALIIAGAVGGTFVGTTMELYIPNPMLRFVGMYAGAGSIMLLTHGPNESTHQPVYTLAGMQLHLSNQELAAIALSAMAGYTTGMVTGSWAWSSNDLQRAGFALAVGTAAAVTTTALLAGE